MVEGSLPEPEVLSCYFDDGFTPPLAAMTLNWPGASPREWVLPGAVTRFGPPPSRFSLQVLRRGPDSYDVRLVWDGLCLRWPDITRRDLAECSLPLVLRALGSDLAELTDQPVELEEVLSPAA